MFIVKFYPEMKCLHIFFSFLHHWMKSYLCLFKKAFTLEISFWDETRPGSKPSLSMVKFLLLFTRFLWDEILSRDKLIPSKITGMKQYLFTREFHLGMKPVEFHPGIKFSLKDNL